jgi:hypothetical protein
MSVGQGHEMKYAVVNTASSGANTIVAAVPGKRIKVFSYVLVATSAVTAEFRSATTANGLMGAVALGANGGIAALGTPEVPLFQTVSGELLGLQLGGAVQVSGHIGYTVEAD